MREVKNRTIAQIFIPIFDQLTAVGHGNKLFGDIIMGATLANLEKTRPNRLILFAAIVFGFVISGCTGYQYPQPYNYSYKAPAYTPPKYSVTVTPTEVVENAPFGTIILTHGSPDDYNFIESFIIKIHNTSEKDIRLDWNKTMFIQDGQTDGGFMFVGVVYSKRHDPKQADVIFAGSTFEKTIWPNSRVFYSDGEFGSGWNNGELTGECGIYLTLDVQGAEYTKKMLMTFNNQKIQ